MGEPILSDDTWAAVDALLHCKSVDQMDTSSIDDDYSSLSGGSSCLSPTSESSSVGTDDSDWVSNATLIEEPAKPKQPTKRKPRLNRRTVEDRRSRKKEQNKTAANRYRMKKKAEVEILLDVEKDLIKRNESLQATYDEACRESKYLKSLLRELIGVKGVQY